jgi:hypothetical protein
LLRRRREKRRGLQRKRLKLRKRLLLRKLRLIGSQPRKPKQREKQLKLKQRVKP